MHEKSLLLTVVIPTYNEKNNILPLIKKISLSLLKNNYDYEILFVDDSTDETPCVIQQVKKHNKQIRLVHRNSKERTGLATALIKGFEEAKGEFICCLDADLQHPPEKIAEMLEKAIADNADIIVASRYTKMGGLMD